MSINAQRQSQIDEVHMHLYDTFIHLQEISINDRTSQTAKQDAGTALVALRRGLDALGLKHRINGGEA
ncbi:MAG: hypothetical protein JRE40_12830 [Deltaproteobacteria bacterium]|nr:hypothetical protein [Deltaproteobacteria bacterium]MBW2672686.1 hypothetical protein [Deltaproteobacteria bacterium]